MNSKQEEFSFAAQYKPEPVELDLEDEYYLGRLLGALGRGKERAKYAADLAEEIGLEVERTAERVRYLAKLANLLGEPVASCPGGFYLAQNPEELQEYERNLRTRARSLYDRIVQIRRIRRRLFP